MRRRVAPLAAAVVLSPVAADARGGGGGHSGGHSSGGHSSSGHGSFGHGSFGHFHHYGYGYGHGGGGLAGILVTLLIVGAIFVAVAYVIYLARKSQQTMVPLAAGPAQRMNVMQQRVMQAATSAGNAGAAAALTAMRARDPDFEPETFLQRAEMTYFLVKRAYQRRDAAQPYLVPSLFAVWSTGIQALIAAHRRPLFDNLNVRGLHVADANLDPASGDRIVVHFDVVFRAKVLDDRDGRVLSDTGDDNRYGERWTFERAVDAKSVASGGVVAQKCPSCGAPLALDTDGHCTYCHAAVNTGAFDWSVGAMTPAPFSGVALDPLLQQVQLSPAEGLAAIRTADPGFDPAAFLARARQAFVALQAAWQA